MSKVLDWIAATGRSFINKDGSEVPDSRPLELPVGFERPETIQEMIRRFVRDPAIMGDLATHEIDTFDDADDFDIPDDMPVSPHEDKFDPLHLLAREQETMSGTVRPRSAEELKAASDAIEAYRKAHPKKVPAAVPASDGKAADAV